MANGLIIVNGYRRFHKFEGENFGAICQLFAKFTDIFYYKVKCIAIQLISPILKIILSMRFSSIKGFYCNAYNKLDVY